MANSQSKAEFNPSNEPQRAFPWQYGGVNFRSRGELERTVEQLANGPTRQHAKAAADLAHEAQAARVISRDQATDLKSRLHL
ncbi:hypothetical protein [Pseudomonas sp. GXZC]|uniref:hypothetical protein n=1 Tax=Pseudomonas sp. GXZC TaxID=3003351 RepID=UPI0022AB1B60|nr:hypothetical protein [Pseudomonas sp. GXZC]WAT32250.1 hypothetical protein OZ428_33785 [Pseudomonas sp. GXZC]